MSTSVAICATSSNPTPDSKMMNVEAFKHIFAVEKLLVRFVDIGNYVWSLEVACSTFLSTNPQIIFVESSN